MDHITIDTESILEVAFHDLDKIADRATLQYNRSLRVRSQYQFIPVRDLDPDAPITSTLLMRSIDYHETLTFSERVHRLRQRKGIEI